MTGVCHHNLVYMALGIESRASCRLGVLARILIGVIRHHNQKRLGEGRVYFKLLQARVHDGD